MTKVCLARNVAGKDFAEFHSRTRGPVSGFLPVQEHNRAGILCPHLELSLSRVTFSTKTQRSILTIGIGRSNFSGIPPQLR
jgi:hypothetical protein